MKKSDHLPIYGVGPIYVYVIAALTVTTVLMRNELLKVGLPEHLILWPILYCPLVVLVAAGIGMLL